MGSNTDVLIEAKGSVTMRFEIEDLGVLSWLLSIQFKCVNGCIDMNRGKYVERNLESLTCLIVSQKHSHAS